MLGIEELTALRQHHPAWGLMRYEHGPLLLALCQRVFVAPNVRSMAETELAEALEDELHSLRRVRGDDAAPRRALDYLTEWAADERGWLRRYYPPGEVEPWFDLTPGTEQALAWVARLEDQPFVGTESRLRTLYELIARMAAALETDPEVRIAALQQQRQEIDDEIMRIGQGNVAPADDRLLREQFQQFVVMARELLADFRQVEHNFRSLDRLVRERIARWDGAKGDLVGDILGERDAIEGSEEGQSFRAFFEFLMAQAKQEEMSANLERVLAAPAIAELRPDRRIRRVHYDWLDAGEHTQRTVALLSSQLRRFLDDAAWLENRRIVELLRGIETSALAVRELPPTGSFSELELPAADVRLPFERPLFQPTPAVELADLTVHLDTTEVELDGLFAQQFVDLERLCTQIEQHLAEVGQVSLAELCRTHPVEHGLAEIVAYLQLAADSFETVVDDDIAESVSWTAAGVERTATIPRVVFVR